MQRYFCFKKDNNKFILSNNDSYHIKTVMRMNKNDLIEIVYNEELYICCIEEFDPVVVNIKEKLNDNNELSIKVTICQSLVKESKMDYILQKGTELGAYSFIPLKVKNSIIKINDKDFIKKQDRWQKIVKEASEQSKRNIIPKVEKILDIKEISKLNYDLKLICTVNEVSTTLKYVLQNRKKCATMIIVIGPEGGFTSEEERFLIEHGFLSVSLGKLVLRTETASLCALSMINYEYER